MQLGSHSSIVTAVACSLLVIGCGRPRLGSSDSAEDSTTGPDDTEAESSSTSTSDSSEESETEDDPSGDFVPEGDHTTPAQCDPWSQDCPEGEKCVPWATTGEFWDAHKCVPLLGDRAPGEPCEYAGPVDATDDCDATSMCWNVDAQGVGTCTPFCSGTPDDPMCPAGSQCTISGDSVITLCISSCDPLVQDCHEGTGCYWDGGNFRCAPTTQDIPAGEPCSFINDCAKGLICVPGETLPDCPDTACCTPFCDLEQGNAQCEVVPGTVCTSFFDEGSNPPGYETTGLCLDPG